MEELEKNVYTDEEYYWSQGGNTGTLPDQITPSMIKFLQENEVFVFGSNRQGMHMSGAAAFAMKKFGAKWGVGEGLQGQSYALPTMEGFESVKEAVSRFINFAKDHEELRFYVTAVGCGIAGYRAEEIAPLFLDATQLSNVYLPLDFWKILINIIKGV